MMNKEEQRIIRLAKCLCESEPLDQIFESDDSENVDWELFIKLIMEQCISPLCYLPLSRHAPKEYAGKLQASYALHHIKTLNDVRIAHDITKLFSRNGINATVSKGFPLSHYIYGNCYARRYSDIDIFVDKKHLPYAYRLLLENNYICHDFDAVPDGIYVDYDRVWDKDMELHFGIPYDKKSFVGKMCEIEIKKSDRTAAFGIDLIDFINRSAKKCEEMAGYEIPTLDETFTILYLMTNTHKNYFQIWGYLHQQPFRDLIDIYCMIRRHPHINIEYLKDTADRLHMSDRICEVLALVAEVFDGCDQYSIFREFGVKNFTFNEDKILNILRPEQRIKAYFRELYKKTRQLRNSSTN